MPDKKVSKKVISTLIRNDGRKPSAIAKDLEITSQRLGQYKNGKRFPDADFIQKWHKKYGQNIMDLMENETDSETNVSHETGKHTRVQKASDNKANRPSVNRENVFEELYEKFLGTKSEYLVIHRDVLKEHRLIAVERLEEDKARSSHDRAMLEQRAREVEQRSSEIQLLTAAIKEISARPINIQLSDIKRAQE